MTAWRSYIAQWWDGLIHPGQAGGLVLDRPPRPGFDTFLLTTIALFYLLYGLSMGLFGGVPAALASGIKLPLLYLISMFICFPAFYVVNCLIGPRLPFQACLRLMLLAVSANAVALASYAPISVFFTLTTSDNGYAFLVLMHVVVLALAGCVSLTANIVVFRATAAQFGRGPRGFVLTAWGVLYALVGTQLAWALRPWVGSPDMPFTFFRPLEGSFAQPYGRCLHGFSRSS